MGSKGLECIPKSTKSIRQGGPRRRQWAPKVRTGCRTCKIRRVKCDESRPSCERYVSTGRGCDGYEDLEFINIKHASNATLTPNKILIDPSIRPFLPGNETENRHFDFFRSVTTMDLTSFLDTQFWSTSVLKACHHHPALFHATVAFGSMHRSYLSDSTPAALPRKNTNGDVQFSLVQFNKAIRSLSLFLSRGIYSVLDQQIILTACILFTCICVLQGRQDKAFMHINNGLKLLNYWRLHDQSLRGRSNRNTDLDVLMVAFIRLDTQIRPYLDGQEAVSQWAKDTVIPKPLDLRFESLFDAYIDLEAILNRVLRAVLTPTGTDEEHNSREEKIDELKTMSHAWDERLAAFLSKSKVIRNGEEENALTFLRLRRVFMTAMLAGDMDDADNDLMPIYEKIIRLSIRFLGHKDADDTLFEEFGWKHEQPQHPIFKLASGVVEPLYVAGTRCRDPKLRRRALRLLHLYPRREGICEGMVAERIVSAVIDAEENNCQRSMDYRQSLLVPSCSSPSLFSSPTPPSGTLSASGYSNSNSMTGSSEGSAPVRDLSPEVKTLDLSPCSRLGDFVCQRHRVVRANFLLLTERQLKIVLWTAEDIKLNKKGRSLVTSWW